MKKYVVLILAALMTTVYAVAVPVRPNTKVKITLADGTVATGTLCGDENCHWVELADGTRYQADEDGKYQKARTLQKSLQQTPSLGRQGVTARRAASSGLQATATFPTTGKRKLLMLLLKYKGDTPTFSSSAFNKFMNQKNYGGIGSFRDYYLEQSTGKLDIETTVTDWIELPYSYYYYGSDGAADMIISGLQTAAQTIDLTQFDNDGDGVLDGLAVIHNGEGQETSGLSTDIWSHSSTIGGVTVGGVKLGRYTIEPELRDEDVMSNIGVMCHEFGHNLGAPDFYDTDYNSSGGTYYGTGTWDLMGQGIWNGDSGNRPAGINIWQKYMFGWCDQVVLDKDQHLEGIPNSTTKPVCYRINTKTDGDYFVMENRQQKGSFDCAVPGHGLIVYHLNENMIRENVEYNTLNIGYPQSFYIVCAGCGKDPFDGYISSYGQTNETYTPYPGTRGITTLSDATLPSCRSMDQRQSYISLKNITERDSLISFDFANEPIPATPYDLTAEANKGVVTLSWKIENSLEGLKCFNVYCNDSLIGSSTSLTYTDIPKTEGVAISYAVDAEYENGDISPLCKTNICVPTNRIEQLTGEQTDGGIVLRFSPQSTLSRVQSRSDYSTLSYTDNTTLQIAHRFTAEDMLTYKLGKITKVSFVTFQTGSQVGIKVCVWEASKDGQSPTLVSEKEVTEFATGNWFDVTLTKPVTIKANKQYWIGLELTAKNTGTGTEIQLVTDQGPQLSCLGNWVCIGGTWQEMTSVTGNFYLSATIQPNTPTVSSNIPTVSPVETPLYDLMYPIGYAIYRDGEKIGTTGNGYYLDKNVTGGHTYGISCLYRSDNESVEKLIQVGETGIDAVYSSKLKVHSCYDLRGRKVNNPGKGIYIIDNRKVIITE